MLRLGARQFQVSWKSWLTGSFIFIVASWLIGFCLSGIAALHQMVFDVQINPLPLFIMPMVFGGLTLLFVLGTIIRMILQELAVEYRLWGVLGANQHQLALLIAVQVGITAFFSSWLGYGLAVVSIKPLYGLLQVYIGHIWLPNVTFRISGEVGLGTSLIVTGLAVVSGFINTRRLLWDHHRRILTSLLFAISLVGLIIANYQALMNEVEDYNGNVFLVLLFWLILVQIQMGRPIMTWGAKQIMKLTPTGLLKVASCRSTGNASVNVPILVLQSLIYGLIMLLYGFGGTGGQDIKNVIVSFIIYVGAPGLLVIANVISVAMLNGRQQQRDIKQLTRLGFSFNMLLRERSWESCFQVMPLLITMLITNMALYSVLTILAWHTQVGIQVSMMTVIWLPVGVSVMTWLLLTLIAWQAVFTGGRNRSVV